MHQSDAPGKRRVSREEAMAIKAEVDYQRLNKSFTDVTFIVGPAQHSKKYVGHRVLLAMTSPVFETMFYGDMADKSKYIRVPDVAPVGFENLLRFAYTDSLRLAAVEDAMLTAYAAKKYLLPQLLRECLTYIELHIGPSTACVVFEFAHVLNSQQLVLQAMNLIDRQAVQVLRSKTFSHVQASTVEFVANRKYLNLDSERTLFEAVLGWSLAEARRRQLEPADWRRIRAILSEGSILSAVRFLAMSCEEFARLVASTSGELDCEPAHQPPPPNGQPAEGEARESPPAGDQRRRQVDLADPNSLLDDVETRAIFMNLTLANVARLPATINPASEPRQPPPEHFTLRRFSSKPTGGANLVTSTTTTRAIKSIGSKFQCLSENVFIVALTIPIRLDGSAYANRSPKFECHLKFTTRSAAGSEAAGAGQSQEGANGSSLLMDTIDESLSISLSRDKDCLVRLKRPILVRLGNLNELTLSFQSYALDEDIVALRAPKSKSASSGEQTDGEGIGWLFFKTPSIEFSELHYYY